jgi:molecular chaperone HscB
VNYFEFYGLPVSFLPDQELLKRKFYEISRSFHPDFYTLATDEEQEIALEKATINNRVFRVLSDFDERLRYILELYGKLQAEGENKVPEDFLMEMMELNEGIMELEMEPSAEKKSELIREIENLRQEALQSIEPMLTCEHVDDLTEPEWTALTDYYLKSRYLVRLKVNIEKLGTS